MTEALNRETALLQRWGRKARRAAEARAGSTRISAADWWPSVKEGLVKGYTRKQLSVALKLGERRIDQIREEGDKLDAADPTLQVEPRVRSDLAWMFEWTLEAFTAFFERYSGYLLQPHFVPWIEAFLAHRNLILNVPPRHAKSTLFSVWIPLWLICADRNVQIILVSKAGVLPKQWARAIADQLELNIDIIKDFGVFKPDKKEYDEDAGVPWRPGNGELMVRGRNRVTKGAQLTIQSRGSMQQIMGMEADFVIVDDPTDPEVARSEKKRQTEQDWITEQVFSRLQARGRAVVIGQRVGYHDVYGWLAKQVYTRGALTGENVWHVEKYPAVLDWETEEVLWPEQLDADGEYICGWSFEELMLSYARVGGEAKFETLYQQNPVPEGGGLISIENVEKCRRNRPAYEGLNRTGHDGTERTDLARVLSVDPSPTQYHGIVLGDLEYSRKQPRFHVMAAFRFKGLLELTAKLLELIVTYQVDYMVLEDSSFIDLIRNDPKYALIENSCRVIRHKTTGTSKHHATYGLESLAGDFEFANITFPCGDAVGRQMTDDLVAEAQEYPEGTYDILMALWFVKFNWMKFRPLLKNKTAWVGSQVKWRRYQDKQASQDDTVRRFRAERDKRRKRATDDEG